MNHLVERQELGCWSDHGEQFGQITANNLHDSEGNFQMAAKIEPMRVRENGEHWGTRTSNELGCAPVAGDDSEMGGG